MVEGGSWFLKFIDAECEADDWPFIKNIGTLLLTNETKRTSIRIPDNDFAWY